MPWQIAKSALRFREASTWKPTNFGHAAILNEIKSGRHKGIKADIEAIIDYIKSVWEFNTKVPIRFPTR